MEKELDQAQCQELAEKLRSKNNHYGPDFLPMARTDSQVVAVHRPSSTPPHRIARQKPNTSRHAPRNLIFSFRLSRAELSPPRAYWSATSHNNFQARSLGQNAITEDVGGGYSAIRIRFTPRRKATSSLNNQKTETISKTVILISVIFV
ncbi:hypothetical protein GWI33_000234 [Rhynchophorus ferrugineus]|uniref:Uncharacterized protein n=1 Tax=Rhynchophorus ferrugineus TaxID=354439 RepID=A0A834IYL1_RHYFE|nr:hypothetical protein GWI33_000234 [Rhynchophorus ferrugineus]